MQTLTKIYKRTSTGAIQTWEITVDKNQYWTTSGQLNGKMVVSTPTTCAGKNIGKTNATTPEQQALAEAQAKLKKKLEKEYKESIDDVDDISFKGPMLAEEYGGATGYPIYSQPKLDGIRCIATRLGLFTRNGKAILSCPHVIEALKEEFKKNPTLELDGELYNHELKDNFDELVSIIKQQKPGEEDIIKAAENIQYYVYDTRTDSLFSDRTLALAKLVERLNDLTIVFVPTHYVKNKKELDALYEQYLEEGYEGQMIRMDTIYKYKRTEELLKRKEFITEEFYVVDIIEGKGNRSGMAGRVILKLHKPTTDGKTTCEANPIGGFAFYKRLLAEKDKVIGQPATTVFQNYTPKGSLRFPRVTTIRNYE